MKAFKNCGLALAIAAALVMTTASCSSENDLVETPNVEQPQVTTNGVQITVGAGFDDASTRSAVVIDGTKHVLTFTDDDKLYVYGDIDENKVIAGYLTMNGAPTNENKSAQFTGNYGTDLKAYSWNGTQYAETSHSFSTADILGECSNVKAVLVDANSTFTVNPTYINYKMSGTFAGSAPTVDDLMTKGLEVKGDYVSASHSFTLSNNNTIFNCTFSGLTPSTTYKVCQALSNANYTFYNFTTDANGAGTIAFIAAVNSIVNTYFISVFNNNDTEVGSIPLGTRSFESKIYNVSRHWTGNCFAKLVSGSVNLASVTDNIVALDGATLTGAMTGYTLFIADGATVTLSGASVTAAEGRYNGAIRCLGDAIIILADGTENVAMSSNNNYYSAVHWPEGKTLTITGSTDATAGKLTSDSRAGGGTGGLAGIGGGYFHPCGDIEITGGVITAYGKGYGAGIGGYEEGHCGNITISGGTVTATCEGSGAGIGAGGGSGNASCGDILIKGGTVTATGGSGAAGIGHGTIDKSAASVTITSGITSVTATRGSQSSGVRCIGHRSKDGSATIDGKTIDSNFFEPDDPDANPLVYSNVPAFDHLNFSYDGDNHVEAWTWTLTHK